MTNLGVGEAFAILLLIVVVVSVLFLVLPIWAIVDAARRPEWQFDATGQSKTLWIVLPAAGFVVCGVVSLVASIVYFASVRPKLAAARRYDDRWSYGHDDQYLPGAGPPPAYGRGPAPPPPPPPRTRRPGPPPG